MLYDAVAEVLIAASLAIASCNAPALLAQVRAATGGAAWRSVGEIAAVGSVVSSGLRGDAALRDDLRGGRYSLRISLPVAGTTIETYDGKTVWSRDISGGVHPYDSWYPQARALTDAYITRRAYLNPQSAGAIGCSGFNTENDKRVALVRVTPRGGIPAVLAIDSQSGLLASVSVRTPISTDVTSFADYRQVGGIVLPFEISSGTLFEPANGYKFNVARYALTERVAAADFQKPRSLERMRMLGGERAITVPIVLEGRQLLVWASVNGRAAMPFILDTGGHAILDSVAARRLGLRGVGGGASGGAGAGTVAERYTRVGSVRVGNAELVDQPFVIIDYPYDFYERGRKMPLAGILGLEWFERYAIRIDYARRTLTLWPLAAFVVKPHVPSLPIRFQEDMPLARAAADGHEGDFGVDTGNAGIVILYGDFLRRSGLLAKYAPGYALRGEGTGGGNTGRRETLASFAIAGHTLRDLDANFTQMKTGSFSSWTEAGDLGLTVLSRFTPAFDYATQTLFLEPVVHPLVFAPNRSGLGFTKSKPDAIEVVAVRPNSAAAAAGIVAGDRILTVNGRNARDLSSADFLDVVTQPAGTAVQLTVAHGNATRSVRLVLR